MQESADVLLLSLSLDLLLFLVERVKGRVSFSIILPFKSCVVNVRGYRIEWRVTS